MLWSLDPLLRTWKTHDCFESFRTTKLLLKGKRGNCCILTPTRPILLVLALLFSFDRGRARSDRSCNRSMKLNWSDSSLTVRVTGVTFATEPILLDFGDIGSSLLFVCVCDPFNCCEDELSVPSRLIAPRRCRTDLKSSSRILSVRHLNTSDNFQYGLILRDRSVTRTKCKYLDASSRRTPTLLLPIIHRWRSRECLPRWMLVLKTCPPAWTQI